jgi:hypothetical protein
VYRNAINEPKEGKLHAHQHSVNGFMLYEVRPRINGSSGELTANWSAMMQQEVLTKTKYVCAVLARFTHTTDVMDNRNATIELDFEFEELAEGQEFKVRVASYGQNGAGVRVSSSPDNPLAVQVMVSMSNHAGVGSADAVSVVSDILKLVIKH